MDLINKKVKHTLFGIGTITKFDGKYVTVKFPKKISKFSYPSAFETFLNLEEKFIQSEVESLIAEQKKVDKTTKVKKIAELKKSEEQKIITEKTSSLKKIKKSIDELFPEDYHSAYLSKHPILTYQQVEKQFGIKISRFGRGINPTSSTIVLISSIGKLNGKFTYHDKWTTDGDYLYSGEGKTGDQTLTKGNLSIKNAERDGKKIHLFVKFSPQEYYYQGEFKLEDYSYENEEDENGNLRKEFKFKLRKNNKE